MQFVAIMLAVVSASPDEDWIVSQGGHCMTDASGRIVAVDLSATWLTDVDLLRIGQLEHLQMLNLSHSRISDSGLEHLRGLRNVSEFDLHHAEFLTDSGLAHLAGWSRLERLDLHGTRITSRALEHIGRLTALKSLDVSFTAIHDDGFENLTSLLALERLAIGGNRLTGSCLPLLQLLPALVELDVGGMQWVDSGMWGLALNETNLRQLGALEQLRVLSLKGANLTDRGADRPGSPEAIRKELKDLSPLAGLVNLEVLDLSRTPVSAESLEPLTGLPKLREIRLGMAENIDDRAAPVLARMPALESVYLVGTRMTSDGVANMPSR